MGTPDVDYSDQDLVGRVFEGETFHQTQPALARHTNSQLLGDTMKTVNFSMGGITVDGIDGVFSQTNKNTFCHIHHCVRNENGIGYKKREFVGSVPKGVYGDLSQGIAAKGNDQFGDMVVEKIQKYIKDGRAEIA